MTLPARQLSCASSATTTGGRTGRCSTWAGRRWSSRSSRSSPTRAADRPGFTGAAPPDLAERLYLRFADALRGLGVTVATGRFGAEMAVDLVNDGPFTIWLDSADR